MKWLTLLFLLATCIFLLRPNGTSDSVHIAVSSNFIEVAKKLVKEFNSGNPKAQIVIVSGSTGKLYAQIVNGAPYSAYLAADVERPKKLDMAGLGIANTRFTYAIGRLALIHADTPNKTKTLVIANPKTAPYGIAAQQVITQHAGRFGNHSIIFAESVAQAFQFVKSGIVDMGLVAKSQTIQKQTTASWLPPANTYTVIEQQAILLKPDARNFLIFIQSSIGRQIIQTAGYELP